MVATRGAPRKSAGRSCTNRPERAARLCHRPQKRAVRHKEPKLRPSSDPAPTQLRPSSDRLRPAPTSSDPAPTSSDRAPTSSDTAPTQLRPSSDKLRPAPTQLRPAPTSSDPAPTQLRPSSHRVHTQLRPAPTQIRHAHTHCRVPRASGRQPPAARRPRQQAKAARRGAEAHAHRGLRAAQEETPYRGTGIHPGVCKHGLSRLFASSCPPPPLPPSPMALPARLPRRAGGVAHDARWPKAECDARWLVLPARSRTPLDGRAADPGQLRLPSLIAQPRHVAPGALHVPFAHRLAPFLRQLVQPALVRDRVVLAWWALLLDGR
eukprot:scaffold5211_cov94-Isochrysis_galbana.AAC.1